MKFNRACFFNKDIEVANSAFRENADILYLSEVLVLVSCVKIFCYHNEVI